MGATQATYGEYTGLLHPEVDIKPCLNEQVANYQNPELSDEEALERAVRLSQSDRLGGGLGIGEDYAKGRHWGSASGSVSGSQASSSSGAGISADFGGFGDVAGTIRQYMLPMPTLEEFLEPAPKQPAKQPAKQTLRWPGSRGGDTGDQDQSVVPRQSVSEFIGEENRGEPDMMRLPVFMTDLVCGLRSKSGVGPQGGRPPGQSRESTTRSSHNSGFGSAAPSWDSHPPSSVRELMERPVQNGASANLDGQQCTFPSPKIPPMQPAGYMEADLQGELDRDDIKRPSLQSASSASGSWRSNSYTEDDICISPMSMPMPSGPPEVGAAVSALSAVEPATGHVAEVGTVAEEGALPESVAADMVSREEPTACEPAAAEQDAQEAASMQIAAAPEEAPAEALSSFPLASCLVPTRGQAVLAERAPECTSQGGAAGSEHLHDPQKDDADIQELQPKTEEPQQGFPESQLAQKPELVLRPRATWWDDADIKAVQDLEQAECCGRLLDVELVKHLRSSRTPVPWSQGQSSELYALLGAQDPARTYVAFWMNMGDVSCLFMSEAVDMDRLENCLAAPDDVFQRRCKLLLQPVKASLPMPAKGPRDADYAGYFFGKENVSFTRQNAKSGAAVICLQIDLFSKWLVKMAMSKIGFRLGNVVEVLLLDWPGQTLLSACRLVVTEEFQRLQSAVQ